MSSTRVFQIGLALWLFGASTTLAADDARALIGRWDLTVQGPDGEYPSWLEVKLSGRKTLVGTYVGRFGSARPVSEVKFKDGQMSFSVPPQWEDRTDDQTFSGSFKGDQFGGETTDEKGRRLIWKAERAPSLGRNSTPEWGEPIPLFNGKDLAGWKPQFPNAKNGWVVRDGMLSNETPGNNLVTEKSFDDFKLSAEFRYPKGSNSGIYLRGRYEVQIEDNHGDEPECHKIGGVYGFITPNVNAARPPGEWQTLEVTLVGRLVTIELNGKKVVVEQPIPGITGGALDSREGEPGPILIQGDHGPVEFRKLVLTPAK